MIVECYSLELYCDNEEVGTNYVLERDPRKHDYKEFPHVFTGERRQDCERQARNIGWMINNRTGICLCPKCSGK